MEIGFYDVVFVVVVFVVVVTVVVEIVQMAIYKTKGSYLYSYRYSVLSINFGLFIFF